MKAKTLGIGLIAGATVGAVTGMMIDKKRHGCKKSDTFRSIGSMIDGMISSF